MRRVHEIKRGQREGGDRGKGLNKVSLGVERSEESEERTGVLPFVVAGLFERHPKLHLRFGPSAGLASELPSPFPRRSGA